MSYWLKNVRLEIGYKKDNGQVIGTETEIKHLFISEGKISRIVDCLEEIPSNSKVKDAGGLLLIPSFVEKHVHLDKTYMGDKWRASRPANGVLERCEIEKDILASISSSIEARAKALLDVLLSAGSTHVRTHVDIYPEVKLQNLEGVKRALDSYDDKVGSEVVAFAQHGLLGNGTVNLMREAVRSGAGIVGSVDPATADNNIEESLVQLIDIAVEGNADIDLHLHDPGHLGVFTMQRFAYLTKQAGWEGRVAISHAFGLGDVSKEEARSMADMLKDAGISIITSLPIGRGVPVDLLDECGVEVMIGNDNIFDSWWPTGNGDILERVGRLIEKYRWTNEFALSQALRYITGGITSLDQDGNQAWPKPGVKANMILVDASCSAETIARRSERKVVFYKGNIVAGSLSK
ncbi:N-isopropylammelide isopropyl amidohydrolase [Paraliobacillus sp. PM-2]|nr:N-isopropylammelide isopropyl amidohydrolase [Paraliobacillus sp. PM-2]